MVNFTISGTDKHFATAKLTRIIEKKFGKLSAQDKNGHEDFEDDEAMYKTYSRYYSRPVDSNTLVKIIWFELLKYVPT